MKTYDVIIIGGGPAGLMAANQFEKEKINYLLLEKNDSFGKKLLLTGGKRCNVTNNLSVHAFIERLTFRHKKFLYPSLNAFGPLQVKSFFKQNGLELVLEDRFKYFPITEKSLSVLDVLRKNLKQSHYKYGQSVKKIDIEEDGFRIYTKTQAFQSFFVIVATGSKAFPSTGSSGDGLKFAEDLNIKYHAFTPAETHVYSKQVVNELGQLQGLSLENCHVTVKNLKKSYRGHLLVTHFGLSGPAILHLSEFIYEDIKKNGHSVIEIRLIDKHLEELYQDLMLNKTIQIDRYLKGILNKRLVDQVLKLIDIQAKKIGEIKRKDLMRLCQTLTRFSVIVDKVEDQENAYVNKGGIDLKVLNPNSMEIKNIRGLYFVGETTDLHGPIGGYNITIALSTAFLASKDISDKIRKLKRR